MTDDELPLLPEAADSMSWGGPREDVFTAAQMREYAAGAVTAERERLRSALLIGHTYAECCPTPASPDDRDQDCQACAALGPNV